MNVKRIRSLKCPVCRKAVETPLVIAGIKHFPPHYPFCCERCKLIDLGRWFGQDYIISRPLTNQDPDEEDPKPIA